MNEKEIMKSIRSDIKPVLILIELFVGNVLLRTTLDDIEEFIIPSLLVFTACSIILFIIYKWQSKMEIVVTDKRVYGKAAFGKRVDLPLDSISSVGISFLKGITISTSSGKVNFIMIKNNEWIHKEISNLLLKRQTNNNNNNNNINNADEIKKYKELLDSGAITQDEYNEKKKQLLNL